MDERDICRGVCLACNLFAAQAPWLELSCASRVILMCFVNQHTAGSDGLLVVLMERNTGCSGEEVIRRGTGGYGYKCVRTAQRWLAVMDHLRMRWMERGTVGFGGGVQSQCIVG